jgi:uncharacterized membrane protein
VPPQVAARVVLRWGLLIGGLVIIADLGSQAIDQRVTTPDVVNTVDVVDYIVNIVLFSVVGAIVVRQTGQVVFGTMAGLLAGLVDGLVIAAAASMAALQSNPEETILQNVVLGAFFAAISAAVGRVILRRSGSRPR